ncbi:MAG TPA: hypothetical protein VFT67_08860 [Jatrophihabitantaceae bacterium]|nr:hypothetical protein [Jatrophihabitantaceae bacterium]
MTQHWPQGELDPVRRLRVLASTVRGVAMAETVVPADVEQAWAVASELERVLPRMIRDFRSVRVVDVGGDQLWLQARGRLGQRALFAVTLRPGWCWMQSRFWVGGIAASAETGGTRIAFAGGLRVGGRLSQLFDSTAQRLARQALGRLADEVQAQRGPQSD